MKDPKRKKANPRAANDCGQGAPMGNKNASKRPAQSILDQYEGLTHQQIADRHSVARTTARRWMLEVWRSNELA